MHTTELESLQNVDQAADCRRIDERNDVILPGHVLIRDSAGDLKLIPAWTRDVSMSGAKIIVDSEITNSTLYFRVNLAQSGPTFIEAEIRHRKVNTMVPFKGPTRIQYQYGLRFMKLVFAKDLGPEAEALAAPRK